MLKKSLPYLFLLILCIELQSCQKKEPVDPNSRADTINYHPAVSGVYILNEGIYSNNNCTLDYINLKTGVLSSNVFEAANKGRKLGDTGNDIGVYGSKLYIVVSGSNTLEIAQATTATSLKTITFNDQDKPREPRSVTFYGRYAFVSCFDGTVQAIDTASLEIIKSIPVGRNPEQMTVQGSNLYVANSGGLSFPHYDTTVSVIDLGALAEIKKITVPINPSGMASDHYGRVYVISIGDYKAVQPTLNVIDPASGNVTRPYACNPSAISLLNDSAFVLAADPVTSAQQYLLLNVKTQAVASQKFITDGSESSITYAYALKTDPLTHNFFIADARDFTSSGKVLMYSSGGKQLAAFTGGLIPGHFAFYRR